MGPVIAGHIPYAAIYDGSLSLVDFAIANHAMGIVAENRWRAEEAARAEAEARR